MRLRITSKKVEEMRKRREKLRELAMRKMMLKVYCRKHKRALDMDEMYSRNGLLSCKKHGIPLIFKNKEVRK